ncbi:MAG: nucleoside phosphorylase [Xanthobacteraceae bacterium]
MAEHETSSPLLLNKEVDQPSVFVPDALIREARRQKGLSDAPMPDICVLDPDGDILRQLMSAGEARRRDDWPCYHSDLFAFQLHGREVGIVACAVGAPFAVLVAEQLFALGCELLISITSAGQIAETWPPPYFVLIDRAMRDEGTSHHYLAPSIFVAADADLIAATGDALKTAGVGFHVGATWTTDAPFRETRQAIEAARVQGVLAVEMEAAALYALAKSCRRPVVCLAYVTNAMGQSGIDFEKGADGGAADALRVLDAVTAMWRAAKARPPR